MNGILEAAVEVDRALHSAQLRYCLIERLNVELIIDELSPLAQWKDDADTLERLRHMLV